MRKYGVMAEFFYIQRKAKFFSNHENKILHMHNKKKNDKMGHSICNSIDWKLTSLKYKELLKKRKMCQKFNFKNGQK